MVLTSPVRNRLMEKLDAMIDGSMFDSTKMLVMRHEPCTGVQTRGLLRIFKVVKATPENIARLREAASKLPVTSILSRHPIDPRICNEVFEKVQAHATRKLQEDPHLKIPECRCIGFGETIMWLLAYHPRDGEMIVKLVILPDSEKTFPWHARQIADVLRAFDLLVPMAQTLPPDTGHEERFSTITKYLSLQL